MLYFVTAYRPRPLKRHRHTRAGHTYDPSAHDKREWLALARPHAPPAPLAGPLRCVVTARVQRPKKPKHNYPRSNPGDVDNIAKFHLDAMNGIFYIDDAQIVELTVTKQYADCNEVTIMLEPVEVPVKLPAPRKRRRT